MASALLCAAPALAQAPVALVREVHGAAVGVELMDYVAAGKVIRLGPQESVVLEYLKSCRRERIRGGVVTVGAEQSEVQGGEVTRNAIPCSAGNIKLTREQANQSAGQPVRALHAKPALTLYGLFPVVEADGGTLTIVRVDREGEYHAANVPMKRGTRRAFFDFATTKRALAAGGTYRANIGSRRILFLIDPDAKARDVPIISRLLRFPPAS
jgi:hypothetical protein